MEPVVMKWKYSATDHSMKKYKRLYRNNSYFICIWLFWSYLSNGAKISRVLKVMKLLSRNDKDARRNVLHHPYYWTALSSFRDLSAAGNIEEPHSQNQRAQTVLRSNTQMRRKFYSCVMFMYMNIDSDHDQVENISECCIELTHALTPH